MTIKQQIKLLTYGSMILLMTRFCFSHVNHRCDTDQISASTQPYTPGLLSDFTLGLFISVFWKFVSTNAWGLLWVYSGYAFWAKCTHWSVKKTRLYRTTCISCFLYVPNRHEAFAFRGIFLIGVYSLCTHWVYFGFTRYNLVNPL